tara:strand:- start:1076 stop:1345 length:270 start_codon:yes stop_codon:yes gene_type:complete
MTDGQKIIGARGSKLLTGVVAIASLTGYSIIVQEDTVITLFKVNGSDATTAYGLGAGKTLKAGGFITVPSGDVITDITMTSGSVIIYNN